MFSDGLVGCQVGQTRAKSLCFSEMDIMLADSFFYYLLLVGFAAGLMDAAVGGGGLLQIPGLFNLLPNATPVASVMGVNKFASCCGTLTATGQYLRRIPVPWKMLLPAASLAFAASYLGENGGVFSRAIHETGDAGHHDCHVSVHFFEKRLGTDGAH